MRHRPILFDLDGVLADSRRTIIDCANGAFVKLGHGSRTDAEVQPIIGPPTHIGFATLLGEEPDSRVVDDAVQEYRALYIDALWATASFPGVPEVVRELAALAPLGVATSKPLRFAELVLQAVGLADAFAVVVGPVPDGPGDKDAMVAEALERLGGAGAMIGDTRYDMLAAKAHGLHAIGVTWGIGLPEDLLAAGADELVGRPAELLDAATRASLPTRPPPPGG